MTPLRLAIAAALLCCAARAHADEVVFYRCTDAAGALTVQNMPCPKGHKEERKVMQGVSSAPGSTATPVAPNSPTAPARSPAPPATATTAPPAAPAKAASPADAGAVPPAVVDSANPATDSDPAARPSDEAPLPPPILFQCTTYDKGSYLTESDEPQSRCVALRTVGLDGNPQSGAGEACEMVHDQCARVPDEGLCDAWKKRLGETEVAWRFARTGNEQKNQQEFERVQKIWRESACGRPAQNP